MNEANGGGRAQLNAAMVSQVPAAAPADGEMGVVKTAPQHSALARVGSAVFFGLTSILIVFVNKILLTNLR